MRPTLFEFAGGDPEFRAGAGTGCKPDLRTLRATH